MQIKSYMLLLLVMLSFSCQSNVRKVAAVVFISDTPVEIEIKDPIDGYPNSGFVTRIIKLEPNIPVRHEIDVDDFSFLNIESRQMYVKYDLLLLEGAILTVNYIGGKTTLAGENAAGIEYLYENYKKRGLLHYVDQQVPIIESNITDSINFIGLDREMLAWRSTLPYRKDLLEMLQQDLITRKAYDILSKTLEYVYIDVESSLYQGTMEGQVKGYTPTKEERYKLFERIERLCADEKYRNEKAPKYLYSSNDYCLQLYRILSEGDKDKIDRRYGDLSLGSYVSWMLEPDYIQLRKFGNEAISQLQNGVGLLTDEKFIEWYQKKFPDTEYAQIISQLYDSQKQKMTQSDETQVVFLDNGKINSFQDLVRLEELKGKCLYIDLWASWCSPCLAQFKYNVVLYDLLLKYKNVSVVYISIDNEREEKTWKNQINKHNLNGFHMRATETLSKYISSKLNNGQSIRIPRYILLDSDGNILNDDLPRPAEIQKLEEVLDEKLEI